ncbi:MAG: HD domain-containing protein [Haliangiales bacterium]
MKDRVFRDPVHGLIEFRGDDRPLARVLETRALQRLRRVKQMGFAWLVYPGAEHSRFGHALGAFHIAHRVASELGFDPKLSRHVKLAALLHDIGHGPFSHAWEHIFPHADHERWGARIVRESPALAAVLEDLEPGLPDTLAGFWDKQYRPSFVRKLVSSQLDVDRLDYLLRDGHYSGAGYATFDLDWILHALRVAQVRTGTDPTDLVVDYRRGMYAVEQYLFARSYMYAQVYHHKTVRAAEWMFVKLMQRFCELARQDREPPGLSTVGLLARAAAPEDTSAGSAEDTPEALPKIRPEISVDRYLSLDDIAILGAIDRWSGRGPDGDEQAADDAILRDLATRLVSRQLFKTIDLGDDPNIIARVEGPIGDAARAQFGAAAAYYYHIDNARQIGYHADHGDELHVVGHPRHGTVSLGRLLEDMPLGQPSSTVRLVCAPELIPALDPIARAALGRAARR